MPLDGVVDGLDVALQSIRARRLRCLRRDVPLFLVASYSPSATPFLGVPHAPPTEHLASYMGVQLPQDPGYGDGEGIWFS
jgi:hypothetical protein